MAKKKKKEPRIECIAYVSTQGSMRQTEIAERRQERYIREYAKAHSIDIVDVYYRRGMGQAVVNRHIDEIAYLIEKNRVAGIIVANTMSISTSVPDAYYKVGKICAAGGTFVTVDEGRLSLNIKEEP